MSSLLFALALGVCFPQVTPTAEMVRAQLGKPDAYKVQKCGGGTDEYGRRIAPWKCLTWLYTDKGVIYFGQDDKLGPSPYVVTGCAIREPVVTKHDGPIWFMTSCTKDGKEAACNSIDLGVDETDDFKGMPTADETGTRDVGAFNEWARSQAKFCTTKVEAQKAARQCAAPEMRKQNVEPASEDESETDGTKKL